MSLGLYASPARGYVQCWPVRFLGDDVAVALHMVGVEAAHLATARLRGWVALVEDPGGFVPVALRASSLAEARRLAIPLVKFNPVVLCDGVARGRAPLYQRRERLVAMSASEATKHPESVLVTPGGVLIAKALNPRNARDLRVLAGQLANQLHPWDYETAKPALEKALQRLDVNWPGLDAKESAKVWAEARAVLDPKTGALGKSLRERMPTFISEMKVKLQDVAQATKQALHATYLPRVGTSLAQPDVRAIERISAQQGWWVRDEWGNRSDRLTRDGQKIVRRGLGQGLGRDEIGQELRAGLPGMWQKYGQSYARMNAGMAVSRARSFSEISTYQSAGIDSYEIVAVIDEATSDICRALDGQIISVGRASALLDQQLSLAQPEDIRQVAPLCQQVNRGGKNIIETQNGVEIAEVKRSGVGIVNDRGTNSYSRMGDQLADASVGMPPYHFSCRTCTVPRVNMPAPVQGQTPVASTGPAVDPTKMPSAVQANLPFRPVDMLPLPKPGAPTLAGSPSLLDQALLPMEFGGAGIAVSEFEQAGAYGLRRWAGAPAEFGFAPRYAGEVEAWGTKTDDWMKALDDLSKLPGLLPIDSAPLLMDVSSVRFRNSWGGVDEILDSQALAIFAREDLGSREMMLRVRSHNVERYYRASGSSIPKSVKTELKKAFESGDELLLREVLKNVSKSWLKRAEQLPGVAPSRFDRIAAKGPVAPPVRSLKPYKAKPPKSKEPLPPVPVPPSAEVPPLKPGKAKARPVKPEVWNARPDPEMSSRAQWYGRGGYFSTVATNPKTGEAIGRSVWREVPERAGAAGARFARPSFEKMPLTATDHVVNVELGGVAFSGAAAMTAGEVDLWIDIVRAELRRGFKGVREYVLRDARGISQFVRYDGAAFEGMTERQVEKMLDGANTGDVTILVKPGDYSNTKYLQKPKQVRDYLSKSGNTWESDVRKFYPKTEVDWSQPGYIPGIPVAEQVEYRVAAVRRELDTRLDALHNQWLDSGQSIEAYRLARQKELQTILSESAAAGQRVQSLRFDARQKTGATLAEREEVAQSTVWNKDDRKGAYLFPREQVEHMMEDALHYASDQLLNGLGRRYATRVVATPANPRAYQSGSDLAVGESYAPSYIAHHPSTAFAKRYPTTGSPKPGWTADRTGASVSELDDLNTMRHEIQHWIDNVGLNGAAARVLRNKQIGDGRVTIVRSKKHGDEVFLPGNYVNYYDGKVYGSDVEVLKKARLLGKSKHTAEQFRKALADAAEYQANSEFMTQAAGRFEVAAKDPVNHHTLNDMWEKNPDQVAGYVSVMRGHYVP